MNNYVNFTNVSRPSAVTCAVERPVCVVAVLVTVVMCSSTLVMICMTEKLRYLQYDYSYVMNNYCTSFQTNNGYLYWNPIRLCSLCRDSFDHSLHC